MARHLLIILICLPPVFFKAQSYDIYAVRFAERKTPVPMSEQAVGYNGNDSTKVYYMYWVLKAKDRTILVDAGFDEDAGADTGMFSFQRPDKPLATINVKPEEVTDIIITHPHWDHIGGIDLYPKALVWMQEEDYKDFVKERRDPEALGFNKRDIQKVLDRKARGGLRIIYMNGKKDQDILPGITVVLTGSGHTAASQYVQVSNGTRNVILASDNCKYYRNIISMLSSPATTDQKAYVRNLRHMKLFTSGDTDFVIPGHDPLVFAKFKTVARDVVLITK